MNANSLISYFENPDLLHQVDISELEKVVTTYPYFALGHVLLTKKMQQMQHLLLKKSIKKTAVMIPDRKLLYEFLFQQEIRSSIAEYEKAEEIEEMEEVVPETPVDNSVETNTEIEPVEKVESPQPSVVEPSSFNVPIDIPAQTVQPSTFPTAVNLEHLAAQKASEMDVLEKQIIGQSLEYVISQELESESKPVSTGPSKTKKVSVTGKQKFSDWLEILDKNRLKDLREREQNPKANEQDIINSFLSKNPGKIKADPTTDFSPNNLARLSVVDDENFVTETLANIYEKQGNYQKSLNAFKNLILKYPEKKTYFAARIEKLEQHLKQK